MSGDNIPLDDENLANYFSEVAREFSIRAGHLSNFVKHRYTIGAYKETILSQFLCQMLEPRYRVLSGFFYSRDKSSMQHDILILDPETDPLYFFQGAIAIVPPRSVRVAIEVKSRINKTTLGEIIDKSSDARSRSAKCLTVGLCFDSSDRSTIRSRLRRYLDAATVRRPLHLPHLICAGDDFFLWRKSKTELVIHEARGQSGVETLVRTVFNFLFGRRVELPSRDDVYPTAVHSRIFAADTVSG